MARMTRLTHWHLSRLAPASRIAKCAPVSRHGFGVPRMGHSSTRAALIYLHSSNERQRMLADAVGKTARTALRKADGAKKASGTELARPRRNKA